MLEIQWFPDSTSRLSQKAGQVTHPKCDAHPCLNEGFTLGSDAR